MNLSLQLENIGGVEVPASLAASAAKRTLYAIDPFFREGWHHVQQYFGSEAETKLQQFTAIVFKPDALVARKMMPAVDFLKQEGYTPVYYCSFRYNRNTIREDWRYQYNIATIERMELVDFLLTLSDSVFVLLHRNGAGSDNAAARLKRLKGPSQPWLRQPGQLRYTLGNISTFINFIHTTDEPADVARALSLYFGKPQRTEMLAAMNSAADLTEALRQQVAKWEADCPAHDLSFEKSLNRIMQAIDTALPAGAGKTALQETANAFLAGTQKNGWLEFFAQVKQNNIGLNPWDEVVVSAELVVANIENGIALIP